MKQHPRLSFARVPQVREHLEWFRDQKFGLMVHWGLYCLIGIRESWPLVDTDWTK